MIDHMVDNTSFHPGHPFTTTKPSWGPYFTDTKLISTWASICLHFVIIFEVQGIPRPCLIWPPGNRDQFFSIMLLVMIPHCLSGFSQTLLLIILFQSLQTSRQLSRVSVSGLSSPMKEWYSILFQISSGNIIYTKNSVVLHELTICASEQSRYLVEVNQALALYTLKKSKDCSRST